MGSLGMACFRRLEAWRIGNFSCVLVPASWVGSNATYSWMGLAGLLLHLILHCQKGKCWAKNTWQLPSIRKQSMRSPPMPNLPTHQDWGALPSAAPTTYEQQRPARWSMTERSSVEWPGVLNRAVTGSRASCHCSVHWGWYERVLFLRHLLQFVFPALYEVDDVPGDWEMKNEDPDLRKKRATWFTICSHCPWHGWTWTHRCHHRAHHNRTHHHRVRHHHVRSRRHHAGLWTIFCSLNTMYSAQLPTLICLCVISVHQKTTLVETWLKALKFCPDISAACSEYNFLLCSAE